MTAQSYDSPASLVAIIIAARRSGDRDLERQAKAELRERFGITVSFDRQEGRHAE